jgi:hypothetical protein
MKKPIFSQEERNEWTVPELEVAKLKFAREFMKGWVGRFLQRTVDRLAKLFPNQS